MEVTRGGGNTKGNPHLHLETKHPKNSRNTRRERVCFRGKEKDPKKKKNLVLLSSSLSLSGLGAKARGGRKEVEEEEEEEGVRAGESRQDLWGLQGCTEQMQNNLTLPRPDAVALGEAQP